MVAQESESPVSSRAPAEGEPSTPTNGDLESRCDSDASTDIQDQSPCIQAATATDDAEAKGQAKVFTHQQTGANPSETQGTTEYINFVAPVDNKCAIPDEKIGRNKNQQPVTRPNVKRKSGRVSSNEHDAHMNRYSLETRSESSGVQAASRKKKCVPEEAPPPPASPRAPLPPTPPKVRKRPRGARSTATTNATISTANPCPLRLRRAGDNSPVRSSPRFRQSPSPHPVGGGIAAKPDSRAFDVTGANAPDNSMDNRTPRCARDCSGMRVSSQDLAGRQLKEKCVKEVSDIHSRPPSCQGVEKTRIGPRLMRARLERQRRRAAAASAGSTSPIASQAVNKRIVHVESLSDRSEQKRFPGESSGDGKGTQGTLERDGDLSHQCKDNEAGSMLGSKAKPRGYREQQIAEDDRNSEQEEKAEIELESSADAIESRPRASSLSRNVQCEQRLLPGGPGLRDGSSRQLDKDFSHSNDVRSPAPSRNSDSLPGRKRLRDASNGPGKQLAGAYDDGGDRLLETYKDQGTGGDELHKKQQASDEGEKKNTHVLVAKERMARPVASWFPKRRFSEQAGHQKIRGRDGPTVACSSRHPDSLEPSPSLDRKDSLQLPGAKISTVRGHDWFGVRRSWRSGVNDGGTCSPGVAHPDRPVAHTEVMKSTSYWTGSSASPLGTTALNTSTATPNNSLSAYRPEGRCWTVNEELRETSTFVHATSPQGVDDHYGVTYSAQERTLPLTMSDPTRASTPSEGAVDSASRSTRFEASDSLSDSPSLRHAPVPGDDAQVFSGRGQWARSGVFIPTCPMVVWWEEDIVNREQYFVGGGNANRTKYSYGWGPVMMNVPADEVAGDFTRPMESPDRIHRQGKSGFASGFGGADGELISPPPRFLGSDPTRF